MAFHFPLNGVLRLRESLEQAEHHKLQRIAEQIARTRTEIQTVESSVLAARLRSAETLLAQGLTGAELRLEIVREAAWNALSVELHSKLLALDQKLKEQLARYIHAHRQREIVSKLYERQFAEYEMEEARRAQRQLDELFILRNSLPAANTTRTQTEP